MPAGTRPFHTRCKLVNKILESGMFQNQVLGESFQTHDQFDAQREHRTQFFRRVVFRPTKAVIDQEGFAVLVFPHPVRQISQRQCVTRSQHRLRRGFTAKIACQVPNRPLPHDRVRYVLRLNGRIAAFGEIALVTLQSDRLIRLI